MKARIRTTKKKTEPDLAIRRNKTERVSFACHPDILADLEREAAYRKVTRGEMAEARVGLTYGLDPVVLDTLKNLGDRLGLPLRLMVSTALETYLAYRLGVCRIVPQGAVRYPEFAYDKNGLVTGMRRVATLTEEFAKRERLLWYAVFSLIPEDERTEEQEGYLEAVREDLALMKEVESAMSFSPTNEG